MRRWFNISEQMMRFLEVKQPLCHAFLSSTAFPPGKHAAKLKITNKSIIGYYACVAFRIGCMLFTGNQARCLVLYTPGKPYSPNFWVIRIILKNSSHTVFFQHTGFYGPKRGKKNAKVFPNCYTDRFRATWVPPPNTAICGIVFHVSIIYVFFQQITNKY